jgi:hypothetical protein
LRVWLNTLVQFGRRYHLAITEMWPHSPITSSLHSRSTQFGTVFSGFPCPSPFKPEWYNNLSALSDCIRVAMHGHLAINYGRSCNFSFLT